MNTAPRSSLATGSARQRWRHLAAASALGLAGLAASGTSQAATVEWTYTGQLTELAGPGLTNPPPGVSVGAAFTMRVQFDDQAALLGKVADTDGDGAIYRFDASSVRMFLTVGSLTNVLFTNNDSTRRIIVRDNYLFNGENVDGITFDINDINGGGQTDQMTLISRGTNTGLLNMDFNNPHLLSSAPAGMGNLATSTLQLCNSTAGNINVCDRAFVGGNVTNVTSVPEPGSAWLVLAAALGLAAVRRPNQA